MGESLGRDATPQTMNPLHRALPMSGLHRSQHASESEMHGAHLAAGADDHPLFAGAPTLTWSVGKPITRSDLLAASSGIAKAPASSFGWGKRGPAS